MDPITHTLIGAALGNAFFRRPLGRAAVPVMALASNLPDVDVAVHFTLSPTAVLLRRSFSHSLFTIPALCALLAILMSRAWPGIGRRALFGACLAGALVHVFFDLVNSFGVVLLWPFSGWRPELAMVFIIDFFLTGLLLLPLLACLPRRLRPRLQAASRAGLAAAAAYLILCGAARFQAGRLLAEQSAALEPPPDFTYVFPEPLGPQRWRGVARQGGAYHVYLLRPFSGGAELALLVGTQRGDPRVERVRGTRLGRRLEWFFKAPVWRVREGVDAASLGVEDDLGNPPEFGASKGGAGAAGADTVVSVYDLRFTSLVARRPAVFGYSFRLIDAGGVEPLF